MVIIAYGDDAYRVQEKVKKLTEAFREKHDPTGMNFSSFDAKAELGEVTQAVRAAPFMAAKRMVLLRDFLTKAKKGDDEARAEALQATPESTVAVLWENCESKALEKKASFQAIKDVSELYLYPFPVLQGQELTKWVAQRVAMHGGKALSAAAEEIASRVGGDLWQADNEIRKLAAFANGRAIGVEDVRALVRHSFAENVFAFVDAVSARDAKEAFKLVVQEREAGAEEFRLLAMLARQVRILLGTRAMMDADPRVTKDAIATEFSLHPFVAQKAMAAARRFTTAQLMAAHEAVFERDQAAKSGMDPEVAVDLTIAQLTA